MLSASVSTAAGRRTFLALVLSIAVLAILLASCSSSQVPRRRSLLVVGDSVAAQSAKALINLAPAGATVNVDAIRAGTAPCDWNHGFTNPRDDEFQSFGKILDKVHPGVVAFVFTGNPGLSGPAAGCVDADRPYDLAQLLASYEPALVEMADKATSAGATVYFETSPPRNPAVPVGYDPQKQENRGFNGSPGIASFYAHLATKDARHWRSDDKAAVAVSSATLSWMLTLPCEAWDVRRCVDDQVQIRVGGTDAVHLDEPGCGAIRFALGLEEGALKTAPPDPKAVAAVVSKYGGCR
jgi:hypothetical protein